LPDQYRQTRRSSFLNGTVCSQRPFARPQCPPLTRTPLRGQRSRPAASLPGVPVPPPVPSSAPQPIPVRPGFGCFNASDPLRYRRQTLRAALPAFTPLRENYLPRDRCFRWSRRLPVRLAGLPDFRSLPEAISITRLGFGSSFPVRYCPVGLLFLKPLRP
jgi:hypothetical protein